MKNQENLDLHGRGSRDASAKMTQMLEKSDKDFKVAIIKMLPKGRASTVEMIGKIESVSQKIKN